MSRKPDEADDLEDQDNYIKDQGLDHENFVARQYLELAEQDEPKICQCGNHYEGASCNE